MTPTSSLGLTFGGPTPTHVLLVLSEPSLGAIFRQALSQAPVPSVLHLASTLEMWAVIEQIKKAAGRPSGPDIVFFQPEVLMANPGTVLRLKQACGANCTAVVLQGSEAIARALQADDFLGAPTPSQPLRKEDLALMILRWCGGRQKASGSSSTASSALSAGTASVASGPTTTTAMPSTLGSTPSAVSLPSTTLSPVLSAQISQLQALQAKQQTKQREQKSPGGAAALAAMQLRSSGTEIEPALGHGVSPPRRPPPLRLASAGIVPSDVQPELERSLARATVPMAHASANGNFSTGATDVSDLVAQVAELRRKLQNKSRAGPLQSPTGAGGSKGAPVALSPASSLSGYMHGASGTLAGMLSSGGAGLGGAAALGPSLSQQLPPQPSSHQDLQLQLQSLQAKQQSMLQNFAAYDGGGRRSSWEASSGNDGDGMTQQVSLPGAAATPGLATASSANRTRRPNGAPPLQTSGSLVRPAGAAAAAAVVHSLTGPRPPSPVPSPSPASQLANIQLQQQLLQLQQLQLQLQQQQQRIVLRASAPASSLTMEPLPPGPGGRLSSTSPNGSQTSNIGSPLPSPGSAPGPLQTSVSTPGSDSGSVSRSNSFVAAGGTRYRPPRARSPSPLGGATGAGAGHMSDTYPGLGASRFASLQLRSGSGSGANGAAANGSTGGSRHGVGNNSGHTSDSGTSPDLGASARNSMRSVSTTLASKSGDDAIAAALSVASVEADGEADSPASKAEDAAASVSAAAGGPSSLSDALQNMEPTGDGGSSTDGRSLMDASFALEDSGAGGRGSISGGVASSIDLQPRPSSSPGPTGSGSPQQQPAQERQLHHSNHGRLALGSHRLSATSVQTESAEEGDQPLHAQAVSARQAVQVAKPSAAGSSVDLANGPSSKERKGTTAFATAAIAAAAVVYLDAAVEQSAQSRSPQEAQSAVAGGKANVPGSRSGSDGVVRIQGSSIGRVDPRVGFSEDMVRLASPGGSGEVQIPPPPSVMSVQPSSSKGSGREGGSGRGSVGAPAAVAALPQATSQAARLPRTDSQGEDRLPSIDGSQPLTAAVTRSGGGSSTAAIGNGSCSLRRQASARSTDVDGRRAGRASSSAQTGVVYSDSPSTDDSGKSARDGNIATSELRDRSSTRSSAPAGMHETHQPNDGPSLVASIEGSITAGLARTASHGAGQREPPLPSSASRGRSVTTTVDASCYTDDIFAALQAHERTEMVTPARLVGGEPQPLQLQPPSRPPTPPARRAARILLCSHPIVITREDFLPF
ncbi:hypothetical protein VOLCADRAFT_86782 [Volvox carteri f. nagariensis]|uniref:Uncharacterized protein n=1 Tax=Volvox carteri f. nagariensis TaxID=3068 RepID=D8TJK9_VOLCA|nr:uncharacterized protein VOLCADRAFT_86782 [Volvox carteri f. nagariensis]EFJ52390.1 hypothetical protein VOLCADRAFT_86782 [Volvox carteri f. nagariensis]|eukprot:XP_002946463.1 hypothetical protein VOLCADRAFT_86782 [Volvox carteri f. nagariensis]